jgi:hypothetical protein
MQFGKWDEKWFSESRCGAAEAAEAAASGVIACPSESKISFLPLVSLLFMLLMGLFFQSLLFLSKN